MQVIPIISDPFLKSLNAHRYLLLVISSPDNTIERSTEGIIFLGVCDKLLFIAPEIKYDFSTGFLSGECSNRCCSF